MRKTFVKRLNKRSTKCTSTKLSLKHDEKFIFKCDQQAVIISKKIQSFYKENEFFDTVLIAGSDCVNIHGHRVVLCALSEYFLEKFRGSQITSKENVVELKEIEASTLKLVIDFMYSGSIELSLETAERILRTASFLKMKTLVDGCCEFIEKNTNAINSLNWFRLAKELSLPKLKVKALVCTYNHLEEISKQKELLMLSENDFKDLLFNDYPREHIEENIFLTMVAWINYDKLKRDHLIFQLLSMVRFQDLTPKFIIENRKSVCKTMESYELICSWLQWHLSPETRSDNQLNYALKAGSTSDELAVVRVCNKTKNVNIETFYPEENKWSVKLESFLPTQKLYSSIIKMDDKLIVVGGMVDSNDTNSCECLDLQTLEWNDLPPMKKSRSGCQVADLIGYLCVFGGDTNGDSDSMEIYNLSTRKWHNVPMLSQPSKTSQIAAHNGLLYILDLEYGLLQSYNVSLNKWTSKSVKQSPFKGSGFGFVAFEGFLYVFGGYLYEGGCVKTVERYNLSNDSWCEMAPIPNYFFSMQTSIFKNKIIIGEYSSVYEYNIYTNKWNTLCPLSLSTNKHIFCTLRRDLIT